MLQTQLPAVYSDLAADPDLVELVEMFVEEMPERVSRLVMTWEARDLAGLTRLAHQLKGSAGSYGFHDITPYAHQLEANLRAGASEEEIARDLQTLIGICQQVRSGSPEGPVASSAF